MPIFDQLIQTMTELFNESQIPHGYCLTWNSALLWLHVISDSLITVAYYSIPLTLLYFIQKRKDFPYSKLVILSVLFILACGTTHLLEVVTIWYPVYWLEGFIKALTAIVSITTALLMIKVVPFALSLPSSEALHAEIRQRKTAQKLQQEILNKLNKISSRLPGAIYQFRLYPDGSSCVPFASNRFHDIFRLQADDVREDAAEVFKLIHPDDLENLILSIKKSAQDLKPWLYVYRVKFNNGEERWLSGNAIPEKELDGSTLWHGFISDITDSKHLSDQLQKTEYINNAILESSLDAIVSINDEGIIFNFNTAATTIFGYEANEVLGRSIDILIPDRFRSLHSTSFTQFLRNRPYKLFNKRIHLNAQHHSHGEFPVEMAITSFVINDEVFFTATLRDITEFKKAEQALVDGQKQAEEANRAKSQFLAMMSHEIRTPLNALIGAQELLCNTDLNATQQHYLKIAFTAGNHLLLLVNDILDLTKVESGKLILEQIPFNALQIIEEALELVANSANEKNLVLSVNTTLPKNGLWIEGDPWRFRQVLLNLLTNAIKFTESGSISIRLSVNSTFINKGDLLIEITDTGIGILSAAQTHLFEIFSQVDPSDTRKQGGSGLGLTISKSLVDLWGGEIGVDSVPNQGSRFWFTCGKTIQAPEQEAVSLTIASTDQPILPKIPASVQQAHILLVEDNPINQTIMTYMLESQGHHVEVADSGQAAILAVTNSDYDLIFMDVSMPDMTGMEATQYIRALGGLKASVPIIAITAHALKGYEKMCLDSGMNGYATKPISQQQLLDLVTKWCCPNKPTDTFSS